MDIKIVEYGLHCTEYKDIIHRVSLVMPKKVKLIDREWFEELCKREI